MSSSSFLIRPRPLPGESLSSFRQRAAWANGLELYPVEPGRLHRSDPDLCIDPLELVWVSQLHMQPRAHLEQMTMRRYLGEVVNEIASRQHAPWWLRPKYGAPSRGRGSMYCAACLAEGEPYFRLEWRLAFNTACSQHSLLYRDTCPHCGYPPWPAACGAASHLHRAFRNFATCWRCAGSLAQHSSEKRAPSRLDRLRVESSLSDISLIDKLSALRGLCQLLLRRSTGRLLLPLYVSADQAATMLPELASTRAIEELRVELRDRVLDIAMDLLHEWPTHFVSVANQARVSRVHFNGVPELPSFFVEIVDRALAKQNRWVRKEDVLALVSAMRREGVRVTKAEIRRRLQWQGDIPNDWLNFALLVSLVLCGSPSETQARESEYLRIHLSEIRHSFTGTVPDIRPKFGCAHRVRFRWRTTACCFSTSCRSSRGRRSRRCANRWRPARSRSRAPPAARSSRRASSSSPR
jgi:hypothetical protein